MRARTTEAEANTDDRSCLYSDVCGVATALAKCLIAMCDILKVATVRKSV